MVGKNGVAFRNQPVHPNLGTMKTHNFETTFAGKVTVLLFVAQFIEGPSPGERYANELLSFE
jgi:hypothetical protein